MTTTLRMTWLGAIGFSCVVLLTNGSVRVDAAPKGGCESEGKMRVVVQLEPHAGQTLAGIKVNLGYPASAVDLPGSSYQPEIKSRVDGTPKGFLFEPNDLDDSLIVALVGTSGLPAGQIFTVDFDRCKGTPKPGVKDFRCTVEEASTDLGALVGGATCTVKLMSGGSEKTKEESL
jgi:hypothetical protein